MPGLYTTGFRESGVDIGNITKNLVEKSYLMDVYPGLIPTFAAPGLWVWGSNSNGQLGDNTTSSKSSPVQTIAGGSNWKQISGGPLFSSGIKNDGTLWTWGDGSNSKLGDGVWPPTTRSSPVQTVAGGTNWKQVSCGDQHVAAIKTDGTLWAWGFNVYGQLGDNTSTNRSSPVQTVAGGTNWKQVSCGAEYTSAIKTDGTLWAWGRNAYGQLGNGTSGATTEKSSPVQTIAGGNNWKQVVCSYRTTLAIKTDGTLWGWGRNTFGEIGDNTATSKSSPVQTVASGTTWKTLADMEGSVANCAAIKTDGTLWVWGSSSPGFQSSPIQAFAGSTNWKNVSVGQYHIAGIKLDGTLWLWSIVSNNADGQLGNGTTTSTSSPVQTIVGGNNWKQVACGRFSTFAIKEFGDW